MSTFASAWPGHSEPKSSQQLYRLCLLYEVGLGKALPTQQKLFRGQTPFLSQFSAYKQVTQIPPQHALLPGSREAHFTEINECFYNLLNLSKCVLELAESFYLAGTEAGYFLHLCLLRASERCLTVPPPGCVCHSLMQLTLWYIFCQVKFRGTFSCLVGTVSHEQLLRRNDQTVQSAFFRVF